MGEYDKVIDKDKQKQAKEYQKKKIIFKITGTALFLVTFPLQLKKKYCILPTYNGRLLLYIFFLS